MQRHFHLPILDSPPIHLFCFLRYICCGTLYVGWDSICSFCGYLCFKGKKNITCCIAEVDFMKGHLIFWLRSHSYSVCYLERLYRNAPKPLQRPISMLWMLLVLFLPMPFIQLLLLLSLRSHFERPGDGSALLLLPSPSHVITSQANLSSSCYEIEQNNAEKSR